MFSASRSAANWMVPGPAYSKHAKSMSGWVGGKARDPGTRGAACVVRVRADRLSGLRRRERATLFVFISAGFLVADSGRLVAK